LASPLENARTPAYEVAIFPDASLAVTVKLNCCPAVTVVGVPVISICVAAPGNGCIDPVDCTRIEVEPDIPLPATVTVWVPALFNVTDVVAVPFVKVMVGGAGRIA